MSAHAPLEPEAAPDAFSRTSPHPVAAAVSAQAEGPVPEARSSRRHAATSAVAPPLASRASASATSDDATAAAAPGGLARSILEWKSKQH